MRWIGDSLLRTASAIALLTGASMLSPSAASAQVNPMGAFIGAMSHGFPPPGARSTRGSRRGRVHESRHERHSKEAKEEEPTKEQHSGSGGNQGGQSNQAENTRTTPSTPSESGLKKGVSEPTSNTGASKPATEVPAFTPSR